MSSQVIPQKIRILGQDITISRKDMKEGDYGEYLEYKCQININKTLGYEEAVATLVHEAIHAALHISGQSQHLSMKLEEGIVICLENAFSHAVNINNLTSK